MSEVGASGITALGSSLVRVVRHPNGWVGFAIVLLMLLFSVPSLVWFGRHWTIYVDSAEYLLLGENLMSGQGYVRLGGEPYIDRGPVLPALIGFLTLFFGHDTESLAWGIRLLAVANSLLSYLLVRRLSGPLAGLLAAMFVSLFSFTATITEAFNIDAVLLTTYLLTLVILLAAVQGGGRVPALVSGLLLGASILTKEAAITSLPLALLAMCFLGWSSRGVIWHYAGVALVCLPWWIWVWSVSEEIYLVGTLPTGLRVAAVVVVIGMVVLGAGLYASGAVSKLLSGARRRRWVGWSLVLVWVVSMSGLLLSTSVALSASTFGVVGHYVVDKLVAYTPLWPLLLVAAGYAVWKAVRGDSTWQFFAATLAIQLPVCLLVTIEGFSLRQFLVAQVLLLCTLAAFVVEIIGAALRRREERNHATNWALGVVAASLGVVLLLSAVGHVRLLLGEPDRWSSLDRTSRVRPEDVRTLRDVQSMNRWMKANVPAREKVLLVATYEDYQVFLDGGRHEWAPLQFDCELGRRNLTGKGCVPSEAVAQAPPRPTIWFSMDEDCKAIALSGPSLMQQMERDDSEYLLVNDQSWYPGISGAVPYLVESGAFEIAHQEKSGGHARRGGPQALVLLERTAAAPQPEPTRMNAESVNRLEGCTGSGETQSAQDIRSRFPNGIALVPDTGRGSDEKADARATETIEEIYADR